MTCTLLPSIPKCPATDSIYALSQGTGAVTLAALMSAVGVTKSKLADQRYIVYGAGSAGLGIARQLRDAMVTMDSVSREDATRKFYLIDRYGLLRDALRKEDKIREGIDEFVRADDEWSDVQTNERGEISLLEVVKKVKPTVLIGCSTHGGAFTEDVVRAMNEQCNRPIIFPLSNPSKLVEVDPRDANEWTEGKALLATGSPFPPAKMPNGKDYMYVARADAAQHLRLTRWALRIAECNSSYHLYLREGLR